MNVQIKRLPSDEYRESTAIAIAIAGELQ